MKVRQPSPLSCRRTGCTLAARRPHRAGAATAAGMTLRDPARVRIER